MRENANDVVVSIEVRVPQSDVHVGSVKPPFFSCDYPSATYPNPVPGPGCTGDSLAPYGYGANNYLRVFGRNYPGHKTQFDSSPPQGTDNCQPSGTNGYHQLHCMTVACNSTPAGAENTLVYWLLQNNRENPVYTIHPVYFFATCSGSGMTIGARELGRASRLNVNVPNGAHVGNYTATAVAAMQWSMTIGGVNHSIAWGPNEAKLMIQGPHGSVASTSLAFDPFSATFPGATFGATRDVVVTLA